MSGKGLGRTAAAQNSVGQRGKTDAIPSRQTILTETNNSFMSAPGNRGDTTMARAVCDGRYDYILSVIQERTTLPEANAIT